MQRQSQVFTTLLVCKRGLRDRNAVRPSDASVNCDKTNESSIDILTPYERKNHLLFRTQRIVGGGCPLVREILGQTDPPSFKTLQKRRFFNRYSLAAAQPLQLAKKSSVMTNRKSPTSFTMSLR